MDNLRGYDMTVKSWTTTKNPKKSISNTMPHWWTYNVHLDAGGYVLDVNVNPSTNFDDRFMAWCNDEKEILVIDGWNVTVIEVA